MSVLKLFLMLLGTFIISGMIGTCTILYVNIRYNMKKDHTLKLCMAVITFLLICLVVGLIGMLTVFGTMPIIFYGIVPFGFFAGLFCMALMSAGSRQDQTN